MLGEGVRLAVGDVAFAAEDLEVEVEDLVQFPVPVVDEAGRNDHQRALQLAPARQFAQDERGLDGLAEPDLVGDQEASRRRGGDAVRQHDLMRQQIDLRRGEGGGTLHERQRVGLVGKPRPPQTLRRSQRRTPESAPRLRNLSRDRRRRGPAARRSRRRRERSHPCRSDDDTIAQTPW